MVRVGRDVRRSVVQPPAQSPLAMRTKLLGALSSKVLKTSKDGACTTSLSVPPLVVLMGKSSSSYPVGPPATTMKSFGGSQILTGCF